MRSLTAVGTVRFVATPKAPRPKRSATANAARAAKPKTPATKKKPAAKKPAATKKKPARVAAAPEAYYNTKPYLDAVGADEESEHIWFDILGSAEACGMSSDSHESVSELVLDWDFDDKFWKKANETKVPKALRVLVPFGKYADDAGDAFAIYDYKCAKKDSTLLGLLRFCAEKLGENSGKIRDGQSFGGFSVYKNGLWVFALEA